MVKNGEIQLNADFATNLTHTVGGRKYDRPYFQGTVPLRPKRLIRVRWIILFWLIWAMVEFQHKYTKSAIVSCAVQRGEKMAKEKDYQL